MASQRDGSLRAYRIADRRQKVFDGRGAALYGGRWNSPGRWAIYFAETYSGAMLEVLAHANLGRLPKTHVWVEILIPRNIPIQIADASRIQGWDAADQRASRAYGDRWYDAGSAAVLLVPSVVTRLERNVVINQQHPDFKKIRASAPKRMVWDRRLFGRS